MGLLVQKYCPARFYSHVNPFAVRDSGPAHKLFTLSVQNFHNTIRPGQGQFSLRPSVSLIIHRVIIVKHFVVDAGSVSVLSRFIRGACSSRHSQVQEAEKGQNSVIFWPLWVSFLVSSRTKRSLVIRKRPLVGDFCLSFEGSVTVHRRAVSDQIILTKTVRSRGPSNSHR